MHWQPQAQFAGYYAAITKGIYKKYGLDVTIRHTGFKDNAIDYLKNGGAQFITHFLSGAMEEYGKGVDLKLIAQVSHKSALTIAGIKSRGIKQVSNLNNKKIAIWQAGFRELPQAFLKNIISMQSLSRFVQLSISSCLVVLMHRW
ncbi:MAG: ABC transporter substrate-binding protein [Ignavibacteriales bacterium]|nr:ABC transporter substrate-binding protein [Ignavibacteriales bacterium]